jgi:GNAT superfamily N-acetyltransferase
MVEIKVYSKDNQNDIDKMLSEIADEFDIPISSQSASTTAKLIDEYWVALNSKEVIGTIGVLKIENRNAVLKRMFVKKTFRGKECGVSSLLMQKAFDWCEDENVNFIYLGTMDQFKAAHKFYEKNGFHKISKNTLPTDFVNNPVDDVFYKINL